MTGEPDDIDFDRIRAEIDEEVRLRRAGGDWPVGMDKELEELFGELSGELTDDKLIELNGRVDVDGEDPKDVAADFLSEIGIA